MFISLSLWLAYAAPAGAAAGAEPGATAPEGMRTFADVLEEAKASYFGGDSARAEQLLQGLQLRLYGGEQPAWELIADALTTLGDLQYTQGRAAQAELTFRWLLTQHPETTISPYYHSMDVVNLFEVVRRSVLADRVPDAVVPPPPPVTEPKPLPTWAFLPLGAPQFAQGRPVAGLTYGALQLGLASASIGVYAQLAREQRERLDNQGADQDLDTYDTRFYQQRAFVQWPLTIGFYALWGISTVDAARWQRARPRAGVSRSPDGTPLFTVGGAL